MYHTYSGWPVAAVQWPFGSLTVLAENTALVVGRTLVDPSGWRVPVLVSNFGQETVMVEPFSEIGMIAQVSAIQPVMDQPSQPACDLLVLQDQLRGLLDLTSHLDNSQRGQLSCSHTYMDLGGGSAAQEYGRWSAILRQLP